jgi:ribosomal protein L12E/L44/L45/RPP1/RPP2
VHHLFYHLQRIEGEVIVSAEQFLCGIPLLIPSTPSSAIPTRETKRRKMKKKKQKKKKKKKEKKEESIDRVFGD